MNNQKLMDKIFASVKEYSEVTFSKKPSTNTCINPYSYHIFRSKPELYLSQDGIFVDGILFCLLTKVLWGEKIPRLSFDMSGIASDLFNELNKRNNASLYLIGAKQNEVDQAAYQIKETYPNIRILGVRNGYFKNDIERNSAIQEICDSNPDYVIIGMGSPRQERFALDLKTSGFKGVSFTCGGFLHQTSNSIKYYPEWINKYNLRAFYRLFKEKGLWSRLYNVLIQFPILFLYDSFSSKRQSQYR